MTTTTPAKPKMTPMMAQWHSCKQLSANAILLFRMGDFYEAFYEDAQILAKELGLTLTKRQEIPMAGVPHHTCEAYIDRLVAKGFKVAVAEQTEDPKKAKGLVKREVVRVVTPGTLIGSDLLPDKDNNYFCALFRHSKRWGLASADLSTGEFQVIEFDQMAELIAEVHRLNPSELLTSSSLHEKEYPLFHELKTQYNLLITEKEEWHFEAHSTSTTLKDHFKVHSLDGFGVSGHEVGLRAAGALLAHLRDESRLPIDHIHRLVPYSTEAFLSLDRTTQKNLELTENLRDGTRRQTLLELLDRTETPMGGRLLRRWIKQPLLDIEAIVDRQKSIQALLFHTLSFDELKESLSTIRDLERLASKVSTQIAGARDLVALKSSVHPLPRIKTLLQCFGAKLTDGLSDKIDPLEDVYQRIQTTLSDEPPLKIGEGATIRQGFSPELDDLRVLSQNSKLWLTQYQERLKNELGIKSLKVGYTRVFGYYIEVSKGQSKLMPETYHRRQTLTNAERYISPELKEYEEKILTAEDKILKIEQELFSNLRDEIGKQVERIIGTSQRIAHLDTLSSLARAASEHGYHCPEVTSSDTIDIQGGRHPVIEGAAIGERFVPNDTHLNGTTDSLFIITGPNMAGKSTYIRQVALLTIMAQMGSLIPVEEARIGVVDKVFTRIGASDDLSRGQSTFMVEMTETANILNNATPRSLIILDEIGRGTSTYDGIAIAQSVAEYLLTECRAKTLFATHYWELTHLEAKYDGAVNYNVAVQETKDEIVFLRRIVRGDTDKSYGIHVARLAGLPRTVINRAKQRLKELENGQPEKKSEVQLSLFDPKPSAIEEEIKNLDIDRLTPLEALNILSELQQSSPVLH